jgi:hypothetical protein
MRLFCCILFTFTRIGCTSKHHLISSKTFNREQSFPAHLVYSSLLSHIKNKTIKYMKNQTKTPKEPINPVKLNIISSRRHLDLNQLMKEHFTEPVKKSNKYNK